MAAIAFNPTLALPARVTLAKVRARSVAVRASARPAGSRAASKIDTESQSLAVSDASDSKGLALAALPLLTALALSRKKCFFSVFVKNKPAPPLITLRACAAPRDGS